MLLEERRDRAGAKTERGHFMPGGDLSTMDFSG
jgi:hypothetical protein